MRQVRFARDARGSIRSSALLIVLICVTNDRVRAQDASGGPGGPPVDQQTLERIPVREVTVFKDGHAFVLHEGEVPVDRTGTVHLDRLPSPVIGTFWPYAAAGVTLKEVVAATRSVKSQQAALSVREMLRANVGARARLKVAQTEFAGTIVSIPTRNQSGERAEPAASPPAPVAGEIMIVKTVEGYRVLPLDSVQEVTFLEQPCEQIPHQEDRNILSLHLQWNDGQPTPTARVGMVYLQKGIRWIPNYRIDLDGQGGARVRLQATLINEMTDLENVTLHLVIGVPHFAFQDTIDPISLGQTVAQLSPYFQQGTQTAFAFSNAIQSQVRMTEQRAPMPAPAPTGTDAELGEGFSEGAKREDLYVFPVSGVSLQKGERMVVPIVDFELPYEDVFTVKLPVNPPREVSQNLDDEQQRELARMVHAPKAVHQARLTNRSSYPLTTAPTLLMRDGQLLGQSMMTYTPVGGQVDIELTAAVDIAVTKQDLEVTRVPNAANWAGNSFDRFELDGVIKLRNFADKPVKLEVTRFLLGMIDSAGQDAVVAQLDVREDAWDLGAEFPVWWRWYGWPTGWFHLNSLGRARWQLELPAGQEKTLDYKWHYFGR